MSNEPAIGTSLPTVSAESAGLATTKIGGVLMNLFAYHALHFSNKRHAALDRAVQIALDAVAVATPKGESYCRYAGSEASDRKS